MLEKNLPYRRPGTFISHAASTLAIIVSSLVGCWSVAAQTQTEESLQKEDSDIALASHTQPIKPFSQPIFQPWSDLGQQPGYLSVNIQRLVKHPEAKPFLEQCAEYFNSEMMPHGAKQAKEFGFQLDTIDRIEGSLHYQYSPVAGEGRRSSIHVAGSAIKIVTRNQVDWPGLIAALDLSSFVGEGSPVTTDEFRNILQSDAKKSNLWIFRSEKLFGTKTTAAKSSSTKVALWDSIAGGDLAFMHAVAVDEEMLDDIAKLSPAEQVNFDLMAAAKAIGYGVEFLPDFKSSMIRVAIVPKPEVGLEQLLVKTKAMRDSLVAKAKSEPDDSQKLFASQLSKLKISVKKTKATNSDGESEQVRMVVVEGRCEVPLTEIWGDL